MMFRFCSSTAIQRA